MVELQRSRRNYTFPFCQGSHWTAAHVLWWLGGLTAAIGFAGLYLQQREAVGMVGFVGAGSAVLGSTRIANAMFFEAFIAPTIATQAPELFDAYPAGGGWEGFLAGVLAAGALIGVPCIELVSWLAGPWPYRTRRRLLRREFLTTSRRRHPLRYDFRCWPGGLGWELWNNSGRPDTRASINQ